MTYTKIKIKLLLSLVMMFFIVGAVNIFAAPVCCEKTKSGDFCQYTNASECAGLSAPTTCDQTSFCTPGCCSNIEGDGFCYGNYPQALCKGNKGSFSNDYSCQSVNQCTTGCCILGTQAFLTTEGNCKSQTTKYQDLKMDFRSSIKSEAECTKIVNSEEKGCCVSGENSCSYTNRGSCSVDDLAGSGENKTGFFKGKYCSTVPLCGCTPTNPANIKIINPSYSGAGNKKSSTMCVDYDDSVHWRDSCGNDDGVAEKCEYNSGELCGDSDGNGAYTCESVDCVGSDKKPLSTQIAVDKGKETVGVSDVPDKNLIANGESWCSWDGANAEGTERREAAVGARFYRSVCINGKELVEPCKDFKQEFCISASLPIAEGSNKKIIAAKCVDNRGQSCIDSCNTAKLGEDSPEVFAANIKEDEKCCKDLSKRDCAWVGKCVPQVSLGSKFWENEGAESICARANSECKAVVRCGGWDRISSGLSGECEYELLSGAQCFDQDYLQAQNNICRSFGDCGANVNIVNKDTRGGFFNTFSMGKEVDEGLTGASTAFPTEGLPDDIDLGDNKKKDFNFGFGLGNMDVGDLDEDLTDDQKKSVSLDPVDGHIMMPGYFKIDLKWADKDGADLYYKFQLVKIDKDASWSRLVGMEWGQAGSGLSGSAGTGTFGSIVFDVLAVGQIGLAIAHGLAASSSLEAAGSALISGGSFVGASEGTFATASATPNFVSALLKKATLQNTYGTSLNAFGAAAHTVMWAYMVYKIVDQVAEETKEVVVKIDCNVWKAPPVDVKSRTQCEWCNPNDPVHFDKLNGKPKDTRPLKTCSEYQCKSLGDSCELLNIGSGNETCVSISPRNPLPPVITFWKDVPGVDYIVNPTKTGVQIGKDSADKANFKIPVYQNIILALKTDQPSICKMSWSHGKKYEEMENIFFGTSLYDYNHVQMIWVPSPNAAANTGENALKTKGQGNYTLYVRCNGGNKVSNENDYSIFFEIAEEPVLTPPRIEGSSLAKELFIMYGENDTNIDLYLNKPAKCKWSFLDQEYEKMPSGNGCTGVGLDPSLSIYKCSYKTDSAGAGKSISGLKANAGETKKVYFRCADYREPKIVNKESYSISFKGSAALNISDVKPSGDIVSRIGSENVTLSVTTLNGALNDGLSSCFYSDDTTSKNNIQRMVLFAKTNSSQHEQIFTSLSEGKHVFYIGCIDAAGNVAYGSTNLNVKVDRQAPQVVRVYKDDTTSPAILKLEVNEASSCLYSTEFGKKPETMMVQDDLSATRFNVQADKVNYFIQCTDIFGNAGSLFSVVLLDKSA